MSIAESTYDVIKEKESIRFDFSSTMKNIDRVCDETICFLKDALEDIDTHLFPINLVIREGLTNAVRHGNAYNPAKKVKFELCIVKNEMIKMMIEDEGEGFNWEKQKSKVLSDDQDHGRGIIIMETYFTRYSYNEKGNILYLEKSIIP